MSYEWISTRELSSILGISARAIRKGITKKKYQARKFCQKYEILISTLEPELQNKIQEYRDKNLSILKEIAYSETQRKIALTKFNIVLRWRKFAINYKGHKVESVKDFVKCYHQELKQNREYIKFNNISSATMFRWDKKLRDSNDNWQSLVTKYVPIKKTTSLSDDEKEIFLSFLLHPNRTNIGKAIKLTKYLLKEHGVNDFSCDMTYRRFAKKYIEEHYDLWVFSREGSKALRDKVLPYIERDISKLEVGDVIVGDGHRLAFQVINPFDGKPCRPTLCAYQDWKSGALLGYEVMLEENTQCIASALRNSIINLGKIPKFVYQDNGKAFKSKYFTDTEGVEGIFVKLGIKPIYALPYNAKAKVIERFFRELQDSFERLLPSFVGECIDNRPAYLKRNEKIHKQIHNTKMPTLNEVIELINKWTCFHYAQECPHVEGSTIGEVLASGKGSGVDISKLDDLMLATEIKNIGRNGIRFLKADYYDESLYGLKIKVVIKYSLFDLSHIKVYRTDGKFLCVATRLEAAHPLANYLGSAKDIEELNQRINQQKRLEKQTVKNYLKGIKQEKIYLPSLEENTSIESNEDVDDFYIKTFEAIQKSNDEQPLVFNEKYQKYDYLKKKTNPTKEELNWIIQYEQSEEYKLIY